MFDAIYHDRKKRSYVKVKVMDVSYDSHGYPLFLFYLNGIWLRKSAKYFIPEGETNGND